MADKDVLGRCMAGFDQDRKAHDQFVRKVDERYRAYRGVLEARSEAAAWTNKQHPPYILQIIETMVANLLDPNPQWKLRARPQMTAPGEAVSRQKAAEAMGLLLNYQLDLDHFAEKQRTFAMQGLITGLSVAKNYWLYSEGPRRQLSQVNVPLLDVSGEPLPYTVPQIRETSNVEVLHDDPTTEICDVRDWIWHEAAVSLDKAMRVTHRVWYTFDELKQLEQLGVYQNVDQLKETRSFTDAAKDREQQLFQVNRSRDMVEVLECWYRDQDGIKIATVGNRNVLLAAPKPNPFWHGEYPFVVVSSMPDLFRIPGVSEVEVVQEIQEMLWTLMNQRLDNLQLINNAVFAIRGDLDDPDSLEFAPGERWVLDDISQIQQLKVDPTVATVALTAEGGLKGDLQNITGGMPFLSGTDNQQVDNQTATGVSIFTSLAQRRLAAKKQQFTWAYKRIGEQRCALNQQFIRDQRVIEIVGADGASVLHTVDPVEIQGRFHILTEPMDESLMRQERRAEKQAMLQVAIQAAPVFAAVGTPLNLKAYMEDYLESFDVADKGRYFSDRVQALAGQGSQQGQPGAAPQPGPVGAPPSGVTAPQASDANAPSNPVSQSPAVFMARAGAMTGGPVNQ